MKNSIFYIKISTLTSVFVLSFFVPSFAQSTNLSSEPIVIYYGCDHSSLTADSTNPVADSVLNTASYYIYHFITQDSFTKQIIFVANESADTAAADTAQDVFTAPPDSTTQLGLASAYWIGSTITGNKGSYNLTIYIKDPYTKKVFASGSETFSSTTPDDIKSACGSAVAQILPIVTKIQAYQQQLRSENPSLYIDPQISISAANSNLNYNETTNVKITATDYDGTPLSNMTVNLSAEGDGDGYFSVNNVRTGVDGIANAVFNAGNQDGDMVVTASISGIVLVTHDTTAVSNDDYITIGQGEQAIPWEAIFNCKAVEVTLHDQASFSTSAWSVSRDVIVKNQTASGRILLGGEGAIANPFSLHMRAPDDLLGGYINGYEKNFEEGNGISVAVGENSICLGRWIKEVRAGMQADKIQNIELTLAVQPLDTTIGQIADSAYGFSYSAPDEYWKNREARIFIGTCFPGYIDTSSYTAVGGIDDYGFLYQGESGDNVQRYASIDSAKYAYTYSKDTSKSQYTVKYDINGFSVSYESSSWQVHAMATVLFRPLSNITGVKNKKSITPLTFALSQNFPNPFNPSTTIEYQIPKQSHVILKVFDILGNQIKELVNKDETAGKYTVIFNASKLSSGVYFYRIEAGSFEESKKLILIK